MEFVYHHRTQGRGGERVHIAGLVRALESCGHRVVIASPPGVDPLAQGTSVPADKARVAERGIRRLWAWASRQAPQLLFEFLELAYNLYSLFRLAPLLRRPGAILYERYAFFHVAGIALARLYGRSVMLEVNEVAGIPRARGLVLLTLARWAERAVLVRADAVLVVSSYLADEVRRRGARASCVHVIPNAVDAEWLAAPCGASRVRAARGLDSSVVVGFVGWFDEWDRLEVLVDVVADLRARHEDLRLMLVGTGPAVPALVRRIRERGAEGAVVVTGPLPHHEVRNHIDAMDICVLADSNPFGSPIVLFEFMGRGKAVVAPELRPITDVVEHGRTGWIVPRSDWSQLAHAIERLVEDAEARRTLGRNAREKVRSQHTWVANGRRVEALAAELGRAERAA
jgi:glycosyltransferase involved in cell wall biosynthesis